MPRFVHVWLVCLILLILPTARAQEAPTERQLFDRAAVDLASQRYPQATDALRQLLWEYPQSPLAPEAMYRLGTLHLLQDRPEEATRYFGALAREHPNTPWADVVVRAHLKEEELYNLAKEQRAQALAKDSPEAFAQASRLYQVFLKRFPPGPPAPKAARNPHEVTYRLADCQGRSGNDAAFREALRQIQAADTKGSWGKLAAIQLAGPEAFARHMDELMRLQHVDNEHFTAFLALSETALPRLHGEERCQCYLYRGHCYAGLERRAEAAAAYEAVLREAPESERAAECAFWLAEQLFAAGQSRRAQEAYRKLAQEYPDSARAAQARAWASWIEDGDAHWHEIERLLFQLCQRVPQGMQGIGCRLTRTGTDPNKTLDVRVALGEGRLLFNLSRGKVGVLLVSNKEGAWCRFSDEPSILRIRQRPELPVPQMVIHTTADGKLSMQWGLHASAGQFGAQPRFQVAPSVAAAVVSRARTAAHLTKVQAADKGEATVVYRWEAAHPGQTDPDVWELAVDSGRIVTMRWMNTNARGERITWTLSELTLGEAIPDEVFAYTPPAGVPVQELEQVNLLDILGRLMRVLGPLWEELTAQEKQ